MLALRPRSGRHNPSPSRSRLDRKSTRLNSSHDQMSYAVFCLKKKNLGPANTSKATELLGSSTTAARRGALLSVPTALNTEHYAPALAESGPVLSSGLTIQGLV